MTSGDVGDGPLGRVGFTDAEPHGTCQVGTWRELFGDRPAGRGGPAASKELAGDLALTPRLAPVTSATSCSVEAICVSMAAEGSA